MFFKKMLRYKKRLNNDFNKLVKNTAKNYYYHLNDLLLVLDNNLAIINYTICQNITLNTFNQETIDILNRAKCDYNWFDTKYFTLNGSSYDKLLDNLLAHSKEVVYHLQDVALKWFDLFSRQNLQDNLCNLSKALELDYGQIDSTNLAKVQAKIDKITIYFVVLLLFQTILVNQDYQVSFDSNFTNKVALIVNIFTNHNLAMSYLANNDDDDSKQVSAIIHDIETTLIYKINNLAIIICRVATQVVSGENIEVKNNLHDLLESYNKFGNNYLD